MISEVETTQALGLVDLLDALGNTQQCYATLHTRSQKGQISTTQAQQQIAASCRNLDNVIAEIKTNFDEESETYTLLSGMENTIKGYLRYLVKLVYQS